MSTPNVPVLHEPDLNQLPVITEERAARSWERILEECDDRLIPVSFFTDCAILGRYGNCINMRDLARGATMIAHHYSVETIKNCKRRITMLRHLKQTAARDRQIFEINVTIGQMVKYLNETTKLMLMTEGTLTTPAPSDDRPPTAASFGQGQTVGPNTTIISKETHIHQAEPKPSEPASE